MRKPDFSIGDEADPYMLRWWVIPRNEWFNIYLHKILKSDTDEALHDHPWWNLSLILKGSYYEHMPCGLCGSPTCHETRVKHRVAGDMVFRSPKAAHRLVLTKPAWTLFITGPRVREWGFHCAKGWRPWYEFVNKQGSNSSRGKGCA